MYNCTFAQPLPHHIQFWKKRLSPCTQLSHSASSSRMGSSCSSIRSCQGTRSHRPSRPSRIDAAAAMPSRDLQLRRMLAPQDRRTSSRLGSPAHSECCSQHVAIRSFQVQSPVLAGTYTRWGSCRGSSRSQQVAPKSTCPDSRLPQKGSLLSEWVTLTN